MAVDLQGSSSRALTPPRPARNPASRRQIETVVSRASGLFGLLFGIQTLPVAIEQWNHLRPGWTAVVAVLIFAGLAAALVAALTRRYVVLTSGYVAVSWLVVLALWPVLATGAQEGLQRPWIWYLCTAATVAAAVAWPLWAAFSALIVFPVGWAFLRLSPEGGAAMPADVILDVTRAVILGGTALVVITQLRRAAASVDAAQATALDRYSSAVGQQATEDERVQVDAIVHDSVLAALLSAARAETPEAKRLATKMATDAIASLHDASMAAPDGEPAVTMLELERRIRAAADNVAPTFDYSAASIGSATIPARAARAVQAATVQSMVNSAQHAGFGEGINRWIEVRGTLTGGIVVEIGDSGRGFDTRTLPAARMGLRVSIIERVTNAGGRVDLESTPGKGTTVRIEWPSADNPGRFAHPAPAPVANGTPS